jgi:CO/xanthine dehydrogenase Mo-binding subunit
MAEVTMHHDDADRWPTPAELETPETRVEGHPKVTGATRFAADLSRPGMLWAAFRRSDLPHAMIRSIDVSRAAAVPGVRCVLTGRDIGEVRFGRRLLDQPVLAFDRVRFVGERIAAVAADSRAAAEEATQLIEIEYGELEAIVDTDQALAQDAPVLHEAAAGYVYLGGERPPVPHPNVQGRRLVQRGQPTEAAFATAARVFEHTFTTPRQHHGYIEPHATLVWIDDGVLHVVSTNKAPFSLRNQMARALALDPASIDIDSRSIGGDFGGKGYSPDEYACYFLARATGRPVKAVMSYVDELAAANPRHDASIRLRTGVDAEGRFVAHEARVVFNGGAYASAKPLPPLVLAGGLQTMAAYRVPSVSIEVLTVYTNTAPAGHMRAPGEVQAMFAGESHVDAIARELSRDPLEFRLLNALRDGDVGPTGERHRQVRAVELLEALRRESGWGTPLPANRGRGVAIGLRHVGGGKIDLRLAFGRDGLVTVVTGIPDQGGGAHTVLQRVVANVLSVAPERVRIRVGTTIDAPQDPGVGGSRTTHIASRAAATAARELKERIEAAAHRTLGESSERIALVDDWLVSEDARNRIGLTDAATTLLGAAPELAVAGAYEAVAHGAEEPGDYNFGAYVAEVEVDRETGQVTVCQVTLAADVGTIINPVAHQGQLDGGFVFGFGAAMMEELALDGGRVMTLNLGDYKLPTSSDVPTLRTVLLPTREGPGAFGAKMAGELSNATVAPAIANAIADAVGVRLQSLPLTAEQIHAALRARDGDQGRATERSAEDG